MSITVVIVTYNSQRHLAECVNSVLTETQDWQTDIILVDNASQDETVQLAYTLLPRNSIIALGENEGFARAVNRALSLSPSQYVLLVNPDVIMEKGSLRAMANLLDGDARVAAVGAKHRYSHGGLQLTWGWKPTLLREWFRRRCQYGLRAHDEALTRRMEAYASKPLEVDWVSGSCLLFYRSVNDEVGGWDESFFLFFEDIDWCVRVRQRGYRIFYCPEALVRHVEGASAATAHRVASAAYRQSQRYYAKKHWGLFSRVVLWAYSLLRRK